MPYLQQGMTEKKGWKAGSWGKKHEREKICQHQSYHYPDSDFCGSSVQYSFWGLYGSAPINPKIDIVQNIAKFICG